MVGLGAKSRNRFKPSIFERLEQSTEAKKKFDKTLKNISEKAKVDVTPPRAPPTTGTTNDWDAHPARRLVSNTQLWNHWSTGTGSTVTTSCDPWRIWTTAATSGAITSVDTWGRWVDTAVYGPPRPQNMPRQVRLDPAEAARRQAEEARWHQEQEARNVRFYEEQRALENRRKEADDRAMKLLVSVLNPQQQADLKRDRFFYVDAPSGRLYRIDYGTHGNVKVIDRVTRKIIERLCIQPNGVPAGDANLMQKLLIETAEDTFRAYANITLEDGRILYGKPGSITGDTLAEVIPIRRAA